MAGTAEVDNRTYRDLVREVLGRSLTDDQCDYILWERTPFPIVMDVETIIRNLRVVANDPIPCLCCEAPVRLQCETDYCGSRCRQDKCGHKD